MMKRLAVGIAFLFAGTIFLFAQKNVSLKVMTYNLRYDNPSDGENAWPKRQENLAKLIMKYDPDLLGIQEGLYHQLKSLDTLLYKYHWVGVGRDDGKAQGEYAAIFYRKNRFKLIKSGTFWLSQTPFVPGSRGWDAATVRIVTWVKLRDRKNKRILFHFNTHFDYKGEVSQRESADLLARMVDSIAGIEAKIYTGDFNTSITDPCMQRLISVKERYPVRDSKQISETFSIGPNYSYVSFDPAFVPVILIDHILVSKHFRVHSHRVCDEKYSNWYPSDHLPVVSELIW